MKIAEIREYIKEHPECFSTENQCSASEVLAGRKYLFICSKGHVTLNAPNNAIKSGKVCCGICSNRIVQKGINDIATTHPFSLNYIVNIEDAYTHTFGSNKKIKWKCPNCGFEFLQSPNKFLCRKHYCNKCSDHVSYAEKFFDDFLNQTKLEYRHGIKFPWSNYIYDFYVPHRNCIIEINGIQHYKDAGFSHIGGKTYEEEHRNDHDKMQCALRNGIRQYIYVDARKSDISWLSGSIRATDLQYWKEIKFEEINWNQCHKNALSSLIVTVAQSYENGEHSVKNLAQLYDKSQTTIKTYLKQAAKIGLCTYSAEKSLKEARKLNGQYIIETMSKKVMQIKDGIVVAEYPSIQEAQRQTQISHVWDCIVEKRKSAGGYVWRYKEITKECDKSE